VQKGQKKETVVVTHEVALYANFVICLLPLEAKPIFILIKLKYIYNGEYFDKHGGSIVYCLLTKYLLFSIYI
jgi:hypothetical protein